jgi:hypothetical protein
MAQLSKIIESRNEWRRKAIKRADEQREQRKANKRHRETIVQLKLKIEDLKKIMEDDAQKKSACGQQYPTESLN